MFLNGATSGYNNAFGYYYDGSAMTQLSKSTSGVAFLSDANLDMSANEGMHLETTIALNNDSDMVNFHTYSTSSSGRSMILDTFFDLGSSPIITSVKIQSAAANWNTNSNIAIYGRKF
jgi:hypothetical protein